MTEIAHFASPMGWIEIRLNESKIISIKFSDHPKEITASTSASMQKCLLQLQEYFDGKRRNFDLPISLEGTNFQKEVWNQLLKIPYGKTISYQELAQQLGREKACRAIGNANGKNPLCIIIPCHRVIRRNGDIGGYAYGSNIKESLLKMEQHFQSDQPSNSNSIQLKTETSESKNVE